MKHSFVKFITLKAFEHRLSKDPVQKTAKRFFSTPKDIESLRFELNSMSHYRYRASGLRKTHFDRYYQTLRLVTLYRVYSRHPEFIRMFKGLAVQELKNVPAFQFIPPSVSVIYV